MATARKGSRLAGIGTRATLSLRLMTALKQTRYFGLSIDCVVNLLLIRDYHKKFAHLPEKLNLLDDGGPDIGNQPSAVRADTEPR